MRDLSSSYVQLHCILYWIHLWVSWIARVKFFVGSTDFWANSLYAILGDFGVAAQLTRTMSKRNTVCIPQLARIQLAVGIYFPEMWPTLNHICMVEKLTLSNEFAEPNFSKTCAKLADFPKVKKYINMLNILKTKLNLQRS